MKKISVNRLAAIVLACWMTAGSVTPAFAAEDREIYRQVFDAEYYYNENPDIQLSIGSDPEKLFTHFAVYGAKEGRSGNAEFNPMAYLKHNNDLFLVFGMNLSEYCSHYVRLGKDENRICLPQDGDDIWIGKCTTYFDETLQRATNVKLAAERLNGKVLEPGETMSFSDTIRSRTVENGYVSAPAIGRNEIGGGICQVSSTLYAAMCKAQMPAVERHPHSQSVHYLPAGLDATISEAYLDLKVKNIYEDPLKIHAKAENGKLTVSLELLKTEKEEENSELAGLTDEELMAMGPGAYYKK